MITLKNYEEAKKYIKDDVLKIEDDVTFEFSFSNINISIDVWDLYAEYVDARNIKARDIKYYAVCVAYENIECVSIEGRLNNSRHFCIDGEVIFLPHKP